MYRSKLLNVVCAACLATGMHNTASAEMAVAWETEGMDVPESAQYDSAKDVIYITNIVGGPTEADGKGHISKLGIDGSVVEKEWVSGLNSPTGMALVGDKLYVADINTLLEIDTGSGEISKKYVVEEAGFLNDVTVDDNGNVYVTDMMKDGIYQLSDGNFSLWLTDKQLEFPNGIHAEGDNLLVGAWGVLNGDGFNTDVAGHMKKVSIADKSITSIGDGGPVGNLDGVEADGSGNYLVTDFLGGKLLKMSLSGDVEEMVKFAQAGTADLDVAADKNLVIIPLMLDNKVVAYKLK